MAHPHARRRRLGSAMTEMAVLLPVYVLVLIGLIYFSNEVIIWQEVHQSARFLASNTRADPGDRGPSGGWIAFSSGAMVPQDYFIRGTFDADITTGRDAGTFTQAQVRDELIKASWWVQQTFDIEGNSRTTQARTGPGAVVYPDPDQRYAFDGDDALIGQELSDWFSRRWAGVTLTHEAAYMRVGRWTLPPATVTARGEAVVRTGDDKSRSLAASETGKRRPIEDLIERFGSSEAPSGSVPMPDYPDFMQSDGFWVPN